MNASHNVTPEEAITNMWDYLYGHRDECPLYKPGLRHNSEMECDCPYEWDSDTIEVVADIINQAVPAGFLKHRADVWEVAGTMSAPTVTYRAGCLCGWMSQGRFDTHGEALSAALHQHLDAIPMKEHA